MIEFDYALMLAIAAFHVDMRFLVGRAALFRQALEGRFGILRAEQRTRVAPRGALGEDVDRRVEPDRDCALVEQFAGARIDEGAAAGRDDSHLALDQACHQSPLPVAKILLAEAFIDFGGGESRRVLDRGIAVDERQPEPLGEPPADRRFSHSHQPHQHDRPVEAFSQIRHQKGYTAPFRLGKSAGMPRIAVLIIVLVIILGGLWFLSTVPKEQPTQTIEVAVPQGGNAH